MAYLFVFTTVMLHMVIICCLYGGKKRRDIMIEMITKINGIVNNFVWGLPMLVLLVGTGILMTLLTKVFQLSHLG